jgi:ABC-2 type transport system permease protein
MSAQLRNASVLVYDADHSLSSRELIHRFRPPYFRLDGEISHPDEGLRLLDEGKTMVLVDIPPRFHEWLTKGEQAYVQIQVDTTNSPQGLSAASYAQQIVGKFGQEAVRKRMGISSDDQQPLPQVRSEHRVWYNPEQKDAWFESTSHILRMITLFAILLPAAAMVREKERGTIEQLLVSPLTPFQIMFSKVIAMTIVILGAATVSVFGVIMPILEVPIKGSLFLYFLITVLYAFTTAGIGLFAATLARNQAQVGMMTILVLVPMILLSGITSPMEAMPEWVQYLMVLSPLRYYIEITHGIFFKGTGIAVLWDSVLAMALLGGALFGLGMWRFRRQFE